MKSGFCAESSNDNHHCVARLADFFFIHDRAGGVAEFAFAGSSVDRWCPEKEADFLWRLVAFALAIKIDSGNAAAGFTERDRDKISGLPRAPQLRFVIYGVNLSTFDFEFLADVGGELRVRFDSFDPRLAAGVDSGPHRRRRVAARGKIDKVAGGLSAQHRIG